MLIRKATLAIAVSLAIAGSAAAQSAHSSHSRAGAAMSATARAHGGAAAQDRGVMGPHGKMRTERPSRASHENRRTAMRDDDDVDETRDMDDDADEIRDRDDSQRVARGDDDATDDNDRDDAQRVGKGRPETVPVSPNASYKARIATSAPGAMADYRHMTGAGRFHIDTNVLDTDHDGFLSQQEAAANITLENQFAKIDVNSDGRIGTDELRSWISSGGLARNSLPVGDALSGLGAANAFQMLDLDGDGMLTSKEAAVQRTLGPRFRRLDTDRDGRLSQAEFDAWSRTTPRPR